MLPQLFPQLCQNTAVLIQAGGQAAALFPAVPQYRPPASPAAPSRASISAAVSEAPAVSAVRRLTSASRGMKGGGIFLQASLPGLLLTRREKGGLHRGIVGEMPLRQGREIGGLPPGCRSGQDFHSGSGPHPGR